MTEISVPRYYRDHVIELFGDAGTAWADGLPEIASDLAEAWSLRLGEPVEPLTFNFIVAVWLADGRPANLKIGIPNGEMARELAALRFFYGRGTVRVLMDDPERRAMLLERVEPGTPLTSIADDERATSIAAGVMRDLRRPAPADHPFPTVAKWAAGLAGAHEHSSDAGGPFPAALVDRARHVFQDLLGSMGEPVVLHGDLHHWNILQAGGDRWLAIDPKGVVGEAEYEVGAFIRNPTPGLMDRPDASRLIERRIHQFSEELGYDRERVHGWAFAQAVLAGWWDFDDHGVYNPVWLECAEAIAAIRP